MWGSIICALLLRAWSALLIFPAGVILWSFVIGYFFPLKPTHRSAVLAARRTAALQFIIAVGVIVIAYWLWGAK
ncbi:MAG TPA: hypothetical protein VN418_09000 [Gammaproteobacteria bacterium]|nr:hypothetical protein [Gammaproteobacteria bacterium]